MTEAASKNKPFFTTRELVLTSLFAVLIAVCSWISVPTEVPFTLQTFAIFLTLLVLGGRCGTFAVLVYLLIGAVGVPVFAGFTGGIGIITGTTGGYMLGFILIGLIYWGAAALLGERLWVQITALIIGLALCYAFGTAWFIHIYAKTADVTLAQALKWCVTPFIPFDLLKMAAAFIISARVKRYAKA
ncbi:MAG: biotin transporter BioY [Ruminococcus sp.]|nr:biotin transporter BioY [Ruminococcus sp.]